MGDVREQSAGFSGWAVIEIMGHKRFAGFVSEQLIAGSALVRVDVPETKHRRHTYGAPGDVAAREITKPAYSKLIGVASIYCITPCDEAIARRAAVEIERYNDPLPVQLPVERQIAAGSPESTADAELVPVGGEDDDDDDDQPF